jgi:hypothetical protein
MKKSYAKPTFARRQSLVAITADGQGPIVIVSPGVIY